MRLACQGHADKLGLEEIRFLKMGLHVGHPNESPCRDASYTDLPRCKSGQGLEPLRHSFQGVTPCMRR